MDAEHSAEPLRIGLLDHVLLRDSWIDPECVLAVQSAGLLLESLGHHVQECYPGALDDPEFPFHFGNMVSAWCAAEVEGIHALTGQSVPTSDLEYQTLALCERGRAVSAPMYISSLAWLGNFERRMAAWWVEDGFDILITPVLAAPPPRLGWANAPGASANRTASMVQYLRQFSATGQPAISLPLHYTAEGLPVGVQFVAASGKDDLLIRLSAQLEAAKPWAHRRPSPGLS